MLRCNLNIYIYSTEQIFRSLVDIEILLNHVNPYFVSLLSICDTKSQQIYHLLKRRYKYAMQECL